MTIKNLMIIRHHNQDYYFESIQDLAVFMQSNNIQDTTSISTHFAKLFTKGAHNFYYLIHPEIDLSVNPNSKHFNKNQNVQYDPNQRSADADRYGGRITYTFDADLLTKSIDEFYSVKDYCKHEAWASEFSTAPFKHTIKSMDAEKLKKEDYYEIKDRILRITKDQFQFWEIDDKSKKIFTGLDAKQKEEKYLAEKNMHYSLFVQMKQESKEIEKKCQELKRTIDEFDSDGVVPDRKRAEL